MIKYQKVIKVGNSLAVTLDRGFVQKTGIKAGDQMAASYKADRELVSMATSLKGVEVVDETEVVVASKITPELESWTKAFLSRNELALKELANK